MKALTILLRGHVGTDTTILTDHDHICLLLKLVLDSFEVVLKFGGHIRVQLVLILLLYGFLLLLVSSVAFELFENALFALSGALFALPCLIYLFLEILVLRL